MTERSNKREQVLLAARGVFAARGFSGASMRSIADDAGVTAMALYNYAPSKLALFELVWQESLEGLYSGFAKAIVGHDGIAAEINAVFDFAYEALVNDPDGVLFASRLLVESGHPELAHLNLSIEPYTAFFGGITERAVKAKELAPRDAETFVAFVTTQLWGFISIATFSTESLKLSVDSAKAAVERFLR